MGHRAWSKIFRRSKDFILEAEERDHTMAANLKKAMDDSHAQVAVVVTGGFLYSDGMDRQLQSQGTTVISYVPRISKIDDNGSSYLSVFAQEKTPLDKLFAGEKLFLADLAHPNFRVVRAADELDHDMNASIENWMRRSRSRRLVTFASGERPAMVPSSIFFCAADIHRTFSTNDGVHQKHIRCF